MWIEQFAHDTWVEVFALLLGASIADPNNKVLVYTLIAPPNKI